MLTHAPLDKTLDDAAVQLMVNDGRICIPTLTMMKGIVAGRGLPVAMFANASDSVAAMYRAGVPILAGTDANTGIGTPAKILHGESIHEELELLVEAGLSTVDALRAATSLPAKYFGLRDRGIIEPGKRADLVLISGDPIRNISETRSIQRVWCGGIEVALT
jgi:imidazolonepropionase-like amidohydrolase